MRLYAVFGVSIVVGYFAAPLIKEKDTEVKTIKGEYNNPDVDDNDTLSSGNQTQNVSDQKQLKNDNDTTDVNRQNELNETNTWKREKRDLTEEEELAIERNIQLRNEQARIEKERKEQEMKAQKEREEQARIEKERKEQELKAQKEREEQARKEIEAKERKAAEDKLKSQISIIVVSGSSSKKIPDSCKINVNGRAMDYQNFRQGVRGHTYTNIRVNSIDIDDNGMVRSVNVSAVSSQNYDEQ